MAMESLGPREVILTTAVHQRASVSNGLSAAASGPGETVFLGTLDGQVEEHRLIRTGGQPRLRLIAKRSISKKVWNPFWQLTIVQSVTQTKCCLHTMFTSPTAIIPIRDVGLSAPTGPHDLPLQ